MSDHGTQHLHPGVSPHLFLWWGVDPTTTTPVASRLVTMQYFASSTDDLYIVERVRSSFCNISCVILWDTWAGPRNGRLEAGASLCSCRSSERLSTETCLKLILTQSMQMCKITHKNIKPRSCDSFQGRNEPRLQCPGFPFLPSASGNMER